MLEKISLSITVSMFTGKITEFEVGKTLTNAEKKKITDKFPELDGNEIG